MRAGTPQFAKEQFRRNQTAPCFSFGGSMWIERPFAYITLVFLLIVSFASERSMAQSPASDGKTMQDAALAETVKQLQEQVKELRSIVLDLRTESERYHAEGTQLLHLFLKLLDGLRESSV